MRKGSGSSGLRRGELRALVWDDVDLADGLIRVERSMSGHGETGGPRAARVAAASRSLQRFVISSSNTRSPRAETWVSCSARAPPSRSRQPPFAHALTDWRRAGLEPIGLHECRHTFAGLLIAAGVNAKAITAYLCHASIQTTFDLYGHLMPGNEDEAVALVDAYLQRSETQARPMQLGATPAD